MYLQSGEKLMWAALVGLVFGAVTVVFRTWYEKRFVTPVTAPAVETATKATVGA